MRSIYRQACASAIALLMMGAATAPALGAESLREALFEGRPILNVRYRYETVQQDGFVLDAHASTLRTRIGYEAQTFYDTYVLLEGENVSSIGAEEFNSTANGKTQFPVVADPDATEINQGFIHYAGIPSTQIRLGRQRIVLDNQRFVGASDFRQNEQTFDAVSITNDFITNVQARYVYIGKVHRIFGDESPIGEFDSDTHLLNVAYDGSSLGKLIGYTYLIDLEEAPRLSSLPTLAPNGGSSWHSGSVGFGFSRQSTRNIMPTNSPPTPPKPGLPHSSRSEFFLAASHKGCRSPRYLHGVKQKTLSETKR